MFKLHTDGGARGNPGPGAGGAVLLDSTGKEIKKAGTYFGVCTNNEAEYQALLFGLKSALDENIKELECFLDSELVVKQLNGLYKVKDEKMKKLWAEVKSFEKNFSTISYSHVRREQNASADKLVNEVLDAAGK